MIRILYTGDIVGHPGRTAFIRGLQELRGETQIDVVVANAENSAGGRGLTPKIAEELFAAGAHLLSLGDHAWDQKELLPFLSQERRILRPANFAAGVPGQPYAEVQTPLGTVGVFQVIGRVFLPPADCPFAAADQILQKVGAQVRVLLAEIHAEATSEKIAFSRHLDGRVSAVVGTHTHVQTADERVLPGGTAYISDLGMTGPVESVLGRAIDPVLRRFRTGLPCTCPVAEGPASLQGVLLDIDERTGKALHIQRIQRAIPTA